MKKILVLGAGFVAGPLVEFLKRRAENDITVASYLLSEAEELARNFNSVKSIQLDVSNQSLVQEALDGFDLVVSLVPAPFHPTIAKAAIQAQVNMITASYESEEMKNLAKDIKEAGITVLNEIGLDPGIDHLSAMQIIDQAHNKGENISSFVSWCGGLPAPESNNNPLGYKFSWAPRGVLMALLNEAKYLNNNNPITISSDKLMSWTKPLSIAGLELEGYPNRESVSYKQVYGIEEAKTILRGTLRYQGFSEIIQAAHKLGLLSLNIIEVREQSWSDFLVTINDGASIESLQKSISQKAFAALEWLDCFSDKVITVKTTPMDVFCELLVEKLQYLDNESDMVILQHKFVIEKESGEEYYISSTLRTEGDASGYSAMSKTVGYPVAIASQLMLDGLYSRQGLQLPVTKDIYEPILAQLSQEGIICEEKVFAPNQVSKEAFLSELM
ncbi:saccharopine dehydrogenase C-terminal domain-containing protein [Kangiella sp. HZ709]|uniref:saccharopine dehydrogenase C-terminal domain-containing protein n=1 Tax=Kangiella sp. HZ709 TaxID=2666328 RepID=UPI0012AFAB88|nr:saccharopine dehydrogenase C-terminal domain-containing protein [Kangiella sp. HZ709]MRX27065.1 saccharopine dehydrogenase [Kangiella sp. HZ709]